MPVRDGAGCPGCGQEETGTRELRSVNDIAYDIVQRCPEAEPLVEEWFGWIVAKDKRLADEGTAATLGELDDTTIKDAWIAAGGNPMFLLRDDYAMAHQQVGVELLRRFCAAASLPSGDGEWARGREEALRDAHHAMQSVAGRLRLRGDEGNAADADVLSKSCVRIREALAATPPAGESGETGRRYTLTIDENGEARGLGDIRESLPPNAAKGLRAIEVAPVSSNSSPPVGESGDERELREWTLARVNTGPGGVVGEWLVEPEGNPAPESWESVRVREIPSEETGA